MKAVIIVMLGMLCGIASHAQSGKVARPAAKPAAIVTIPEEATASPSTLAKWLKAHTSSQHALQQALFNWMAGHIAYDVENSNQVSSYRDSAAAMLKTLQTRKGLCTDYAVLYAQVCREAGITAIVVTGYALAHDIMVPTGSHDWVVVKNGSQWTVTDPTWGAGIAENGRFVQRTNWSWFQVSPQVAVKTHMPYDPMWQLLSFPVRHDELGSTAFAAAAKRPAFAYGDSLNAWFRQSRLERLQHASARIRRFGGATNPFIMTELDWMDQSIQVLAGNQEIEARNRWIDQFNGVNREYTEIVKTYNEYVGFKNRQFTPAVQDGVLRKMIDGIAGRLAAAERLLLGLKTTEDALRQHMEELREALVSMKGQVGSEQAFVGKYLKTEKGKRPGLFYVSDKL